MSKQLVFNSTHPRASISQDYWGDIKEDWGSGDGSPPVRSTGGASVGGPSGVQGQSPGRGFGGQSPPEAEAFCETTHNICIKIQQTTVAVTRVDILNDITSKILGYITMDVPPFINIGGGMSPLSDRDRRPHQTYMQRNTERNKTE